MKRKYEKGMSMMLVDTTEMCDLTNLTGKTK